MSSAAHLCGCLASRMNVEFGEHALCVVSGGVVADIQGGCDGRVGAALPQEHGNFGFPCCEPVPRLQVGRPGQRPFRSSVLTAAAMLAQLAAQISHLPKRLANLAQQPLSIVS